MTDEAQSLFFRSLKAHREGDLTAAAAGYRDVLAARPDHIDAAHYLGMVYYQQGDLARSLQLVARAAQARPEDSAVLANLGLVLLGAGRNRDAGQREGARLRHGQRQPLRDLRLQGRGWQR